ncbi:MAG: ABC transporter permease [Vicinamibacterales bacterium]
MSLIDDLRHAVRAWRRAPAFVGLALVTLALGIGTTSAMFSVVYGVLLRPLPFRAPERLVQVWHVSADGRRGNFPAGAFHDLQREARGVRNAAASIGTAVGLGTGADAARVSGAVVTTNFFDVLGATPALGRAFSSAADTPGGDGVVLADGAWRQHFGADPAVVGRTIRLDGVPATVLGVMAPEFDYPTGARVWRLPERSVPAPPLEVEGDPETNRDVGYLDVVARLTDGVSVREAEADLRVLGTTLAERYPDTDKNEGFALTPVHEALVGDARPSLLVLFGAVGLVLLIACTNLAGLLVARALGRRREFAVRTALGAGGPRLVRQLLAESLLLALAGGLLGVVAGVWLLDGLRALLPESMPRAAEIRLDAAAVTFAFAVSALVGLAFGAVPAWWSTRQDAASALHDGGRTSTGGRQRGRRALVVAQVALAVVLLAGAGVMVKSLVSLQRRDIGFAPEGVVTQQIVLPQARFDNAAQVRFFRQVTERLRQDPRVSAATVVFPTPLVNNQANASVRLDRPRPGDPSDREYRVRLASIGRQYFATLGIAFVAGRDFEARDLAEDAHALIVNRTLAEHLLGGGDVLDRRIGFGEDASDAYRVIGVVADAAAASLDADPDPTVYLPFTQLTLPFMRLMARGRGPDAGIRDAIVTAVRTEAPDLALDPAEPLTDVVRAAADEPRFRARLSAVFAAVALALASLGLYGLLTVSVAARTREFATRLALGATPAAMRAGVLREGLVLTGLGLATGVAVVVALGRLVNRLLFHTTTADPVILGGLAALMLVASAAACYLPARRATLVDPMTALRAD